MSKKKLTILAFKFELPYWSSNVFSATEIITSSWYSPKISTSGAVKIAEYKVSFSLLKLVNSPIFMSNNSELKSFGSSVKDSVMISVWFKTIVSLDASNTKSGPLVSTLTESK